MEFSGCRFFIYRNNLLVERKFPTRLKFEKEVSNFIVLSYFRESLHRTIFGSSTSKPFSISRWNNENI